VDQLQAKVIFSHPDFAGIHFTGSTGVFQNIWKTIGENIHLYKTYPRIVGETGGKDFIFAHKSAMLQLSQLRLQEAHLNIKVKNVQPHQDVIFLIIFGQQ
jgi:acyl-CoA reductase-like NAD-dependent aldehyde dehydrogenase